MWVQKILVTVIVHRWIVRNDEFYHTVEHIETESYVQFKCKQISNTRALMVEYLTEGDKTHYDDVIMGAIASQITSLTIVYSTAFRRR